MSFASNGSDRFRVDSSAAVLRELDRLQRRATHRGQGKSCKAAFRRILRALRDRPLTLGEPLYYLKTMHVEVRAVLVAPLLIEFAVSREHQIVWIKTGKPLGKRSP